MSEKQQSALEKWRQAMRLKDSRNWDSAAKLIEDLLREQSDWEHGYGHYHLAECYEERERTDKARIAYESAVSKSPTDPALLGGLASFLYLHGDAAEAFDRYLQLLALDRKQGNEAGAAQTLTALRTLGSRLNLSEEEIESKVRLA